MTDLDARCLDAFPNWLRGLAQDARALSEIVLDEGSSADQRRHVTRSLNYLFKSLDLIPDGIEDLGFIDDAFVFRVGAAAALGAGAPADGAVARLAADAQLIEEFMAEDHGRLVRYVASLDSVVARGRSVDDVLGDPAAAADLARDVREWADAYQAPSFARDPKTLVKLRAFLAAKLPA